MSTHPIVRAWLSSLSYGKDKTSGEEDTNKNPVGGIARVYEVARNAMEYRADHLVRRAAIERILKRQAVFEKDSLRLSENLLEELSWARYVSEKRSDESTKKEVAEILKKYLNILNGSGANNEWILGMASAEIESLLNPNSDYHRFTNFAFHVLKQRVNLPNVENIDLLLYIAVDKVFSQSDDQQVAFHLGKIISGQLGENNSFGNVVKEVKRFQDMAKDSKISNTLGVFVRKQMSPLILLRDMYFYNPLEFRESLNNEKEFGEMGRKVLLEQLLGMRKRMGTATIRSLIYVFLTKMVIAFGIEIPIEKLISGSSNNITLGINLLFPVILMWALTTNIHFPKRQERDKIVARSWQIVSDFEAKADSREILIRRSRSPIIKSVLFYLFYTVLFLLIFSLIIWGLRFIGFNIASVAIFLFFLSVISFFAYRIRQMAQVYFYRPKTSERSSWGDMVALPVIIVGSFLSKEVARLNFLVFVFDFILEAPLKIILKFLDNWSQFLSLKKDEAIGG